MTRKLSETRIHKIINVLKKSPKPTLTIIAEETGIPKPTAYRYVRRLIEEGIVTYDGRFYMLTTTKVKRDIVNEAGELLGDEVARRIKELITDKIVDLLPRSLRIVKRIYYRAEVRKALPLMVRSLVDAVVESTFSRVSLLTLLMICHAYFVQRAYELLYESLKLTPKSLFGGDEEYEKIGEAMKEETELVKLFRENSAVEDMDKLAQYMINITDMVIPRVQQSNVVSPVLSIVIGSRQREEILVIMGKSLLLSGPRPLVEKEVELLKKAIGLA